MAGLELSTRHFIAKIVAQLAPGWLGIIRSTRRPLDARPSGNFLFRHYARLAQLHGGVSAQMEPVTIAECFAFLLSDRASVVPGTDLLMDAGLIAAGSREMVGGGLPEVLSSGPRIVGRYTVSGKDALG